MVKKGKAVDYAGPWIYCGPDLPGAIKKNSIYTKKLPAELEKYAAKCPAVLGLIVVPARLQETRNRIEVAGTAENQFYSKILQYRKGLNK